MHDLSADHLDTSGDVESPSGGARAKPNPVVRIVISNVQRSPKADTSRNNTSA
jgi:hypothetical protein